MRTLSALLVLSLFLSLAACGDGEDRYEFEDIRDRNKPRHDVPDDMTAAERLGFKKRSGAHPHGGMDMGGMNAAHGGGMGRAPEFAWNTPEGWKDVPGSGMRAASWAVDGAADTDASLTILPTGGDPIMNVNRWRKEMGQAPIDKAALKELPRLKMLGAPSIYLDVSGDYSGGASGRGAVKGARLLGVILTAPTSMIFLKFTGPADVVAAQKSNFEKLAASIEVKEPKMPAGVPGHGGGPSRGPTAWTVPEGWTQQPAKMMRVVTLVPDDLPQAWCYASVVGGGMALNLNRWRREMGKGPLSDQEIGGLEKVTVMGRDAVLLDVTGEFKGTGGPPQANAKMFGLVCPLGDMDLFVKMVGPADKMEGQRGKFIEFCKSMK